MNDSDLQHLRAAIALAWRAREHGNHPFGALLVDDQNQVVLQAENTVVTARDCTGNAETNLMRQASQRFSPEQLAYMHAVYEYRTMCHVCRRHPLGQGGAGSVCAECYRSLYDRRPIARAPAAAVPRGVCTQPAADRRARPSIGSGSQNGACRLLDDIA